jgi:4-hydroxy-4-methyl-2-oxoglutarate aldolase
MKGTLCFVSCLVASFFAPPATAQLTPPALTDAELLKGANLLPYGDYSEEDPMVLVKKYEGLRVTDVVDAMQAVGLQDIGSMDHTIRPLWRDTSPKLTHRIYGVAITYRYVPTNKPPAHKMPLDEFRKWHSYWYRTYAPESFSRIVRPGMVIVIDAQGIDNVGFIGSNNSLGWKSRGAAGVITNAGCRDTDEIILEKIPVYSKYISHGTRPGRIEAASINQPVVVGGVLVRPWDMVVADGDGVVVVPHEVAEQVAEIAWGVAKGDKAGRRKLYDKMDMPIDETVK